MLVTTDEAAEVARHLWAQIDSARSADPDAVEVAACATMAALGHPAHAWWVLQRNAARQYDPLREIPSRQLQAICEAMRCV